MLSLIPVREPCSSLSISPINAKMPPKIFNKRIKRCLIPMGSTVLVQMSLCAEVLRYIFKHILHNRQFCENNIVQPQQICVPAYQRSFHVSPPLPACRHTAPVLSVEDVYIRFMVYFRVSAVLNVTLFKTFFHNTA